MTDTATAPPTTASRRPRATLERLLIGAGVQLLLEEGLGTPGDSITFKRVFDHLEETKGIRITHASVIGRIWPDQLEFRRDVLKALATDNGSATAVRTGEALAGQLASSDLSTVASRRSALREIIRFGCEWEVTENLFSAGWRERSAVWAVEASRGAGADPHVEASLRGARDRVLDRYRYLYGTVIRELGFRLRPPFTLEELVRVATALAEGCNQRALVGVGPSTGLRRPTGPGGEVQEWTLLGIGLDTLVETFIEPVPGWIPAA